MPAPNSIENALARLMPPALSESGRRSLEAMLDELAAAAPGTSAATPDQPWYARRAVPFGIAATLAALLALAPRMAVVTQAPRVDRAATAAKSGLVLVSESDRIEAMSDEGWMADEDGEAMQAVRVRVVEANTLRDVETGIVVQVSDPREEMILTPVTTF